MQRLSQFSPEARLTVGTTEYNSTCGYPEAITDANGNTVPGSRARYLPFGGYRELPTAGLDCDEFPATVSASGAYTQAQVGAYQYAHTYTFSSGSTFSGSGAVTVSDRAGNVAGVPLTVTRDVASPTAVLTVAERSSSVTLTVAWGGEDGTGAGVATYDVQVREDEGGWTDWLTETAQTQGEYVGQYGHRYGFRVRATDRVSNTGDWVEGTSFLAWVTKYYAFNGQRVAMREGDVVYYLHGDHLGSTSVASSDSGVLHSRQGYYPYGEVRYVTGKLPTEFGFTGQRNESTIGLYDYHARFYDPFLGRFISADTIVPSPAEPQDLNRYTYVRNNPLLYVDPSGHGGPEDWLRALAESGPVGEALVVGMSEVVEKFNEYREDIFFPDADTTFGERLEACTVVGGGSALLAAAGTEVVAGTLTTAATTGGATTVTTAATTATTATTAVCADGNCTNEANAILDVGQELLKPYQQMVIQQMKYGPLQMLFTNILKMV